jgi:hypothetical protein
MDWLLILTTIAFFALCGLYAIACNRL